MPEDELLEDGQEEVFSRTEVLLGRIEHHAEAGGASDREGEEPDGENPDGAGPDGEKPEEEASRPRPEGAAGKESAADGR